MKSLHGVWLLFYSYFQGQSIQHLQGKVEANPCPFCPITSYSMLVNYQFCQDYAVSPQIISRNHCKQYTLSNRDQDI